ncbi:MAG: tripartite tricarboxylate transporter substrate-binding protein, partial [Usitatibacteraceae bacterium]
DVPTVAESGVPGFETGSWQGIIAPAGTPPDSVAKLNTEIIRILGTADMKEKLLAQGAEARTNSPEVFGGFIAKEKDRWAKVVKGAGIKIE